VKFSLGKHKVLNDGEQAMRNLIIEWLSATVAGLRLVDFTVLNQ